MDKGEDWIFVENNDNLVSEFETISICDKTDEETSQMKNKCSYASTLLKSNQSKSFPSARILPNVQKKETVLIKRDDDDDQQKLSSYIESKPGSQYRNPRDKAGQNKVHRRRPRSSEPPKNPGNSLRVACSFCNPKFANRAERRRTLRQQRSIVNWKDDDY